jgi:hypothetical protein
VRPELFRSGLGHAPPHRQVVGNEGQRPGNRQQPWPAGLPGVSGSGTAALLAAASALFVRDASVSSASAPWQLPPNSSGQVIQCRDGGRAQVSQQRAAALQPGDGSVTSFTTGMMPVTPQVREVRPCSPATQDWTHGHLTEGGGAGLSMLPASTGQASGSSCGAVACPAHTALRILLSDFGE